MLGAQVVPAGCDATPCDAEAVSLESVGHGEVTLVKAEWQGRVCAKEGMGEEECGGASAGYDYGERGLD